MPRQGRPPPCRASPLAQDPAERAGGHAHEELFGRVFVTLEGIDRSGKTTQAALLTEALGPETLLLREPGGTDAGERIRALLKDPAPTSTLEPSCSCSAPRGRDSARGSCDRRSRRDGRRLRSVRGLDRRLPGRRPRAWNGLVERLNEIAIAGCLPGPHGALRIDPDAAESRGHERLARGGADGVDRFEGQGIEFQRVVAAAYDDLAARHPERIAVVDAEEWPRCTPG